MGCQFFLKFRTFFCGFSYCVRFCEIRKYRRLCGTSRHPMDHLWMCLLLIVATHSGITQSQIGQPTATASPFVILPKIVGGYTVTIDQVPFQVSVRRRSIHERHYGLGHVCGGAVISQRVVCSAAHCYAMWVKYVNRIHEISVTTICFLEIPQYHWSIVIPSYMW